MYQESEGLSQKRVWLLTVTNFFSRLITSLGFVAIIFFLPLQLSVILSLLYGLTILSVVSYIIAKSRHMNPWHTIIEHLLIAIAVILLSKLLGGFVVRTFR